MRPPCTLTFPDGSDPRLEVVTLDWTEAMSQVFELSLLTQSTDAHLEMKALIGRRAVVSLEGDRGLDPIEGIVVRVRQLSAETTGVSRYVLDIAPPLWLTTRRVDHRIFQDLSVPEIVAAVLASYGGRIPPPILRIGRAMPKLEHCAQYGETDHDFIFRLLADEGIAAFFDHAHRSAWVLVDDTTRLTPEVAGAIPYLEASGLDGTRHRVWSVTVTEMIETSAVTLRDDDPRNPTLLIEGRAIERGAELFLNEGDLEAYGFEVGKVVSGAEANARAGRQLEAARALRRRLSLEASFVLGAGTRMTLRGHPRGDVDGPLLVVGATAHVEAGGATHRMECIDAARPFRPARRPKPRIAGTQTAVVVGAGDEEIDVDALGRVLVELPWDRRAPGARSSRRVRVSHGWAGQTHGLVCLPRVGDEVVITYLDGDPDQPLVVGRVHDAVNVGPLRLPAQKTVSVWRTRSSPGGDGYNEILMDDAAGAERMTLRAQRDFRQEVAREAEIHVGVRQTTRVGGSASSSVAGDQSLSAGGTFSVSAGAAIQLSTDALGATAKSTLHLTTPGERLDESGNHLARANAIYLQAREICQVTGPAFHVFCDHIVLQAGGSRIELRPGGITIESSGVIDLRGELIKLNS